jgi:hypothetical protein
VAWTEVLLPEDVGAFEIHRHGAIFAWDAGDVRVACAVRPARRRSTARKTYEGYVRRLYDLEHEPVAQALAIERRSAVFIAALIESGRVTAFKLDRFPPQRGESSSGVREPRRPSPSHSGAASVLDLPD